MSSQQQLIVTVRASQHACSNQYPHLIATPTGRNRQCSFVHCVLVLAVAVHIRQVVAVDMLALGAFL